MIVKVIKSTSEVKPSTSKNWADILCEAIDMMGMGVEPRSALKQCANDSGIPYGEEMQEFVEWAEAQWLRK
jgi:hypothetical protein